MENNAYTDELQHWGIKGQRWGQRRYQNKDGSLTPAGKQRYNQELAKLKAEEEKVKAAEKVAATKKRTQAKIDKLDAKKHELEERKKALKGKKSGDSDNDNPMETAEEKKARLLKSTDANELYKNKDLLSNNELQERVNRLNLEAQLQSKMSVEKQKSGLEYMDQARNVIDKSTNLYRSVDNAYSAVANSAIGKSVAKQLGLEPPKKEFKLDEFVKNMSTKSNQEVQEAAKRIKNEKAIMDAINNAGKKSVNDTSNRGVSVDDVQDMIDDALQNRK